MTIIILYFSTLEPNVFNINNISYIIIKKTLNSFICKKKRGNSPKLVRESSFSNLIETNCSFIHKWVIKQLPSSRNIKSNYKISFKEFILIEHIALLVYNSSVICDKDLKGVSNC